MFQNTKRKYGRSQSAAKVTQLEQLTLTEVFDQFIAMKNTIDDYEVLSEKRRYSCQMMVVLFSLIPGAQDYLNTESRPKSKYSLYFHIWNLISCSFIY